MLQPDTAPADGTPSAPGDRMFLPADKPNCKPCRHQVSGRFNRTPHQPTVLRRPQVSGCLNRTPLYQTPHYRTVSLWKLLCFFDPKRRGMRARKAAYPNFSDFCLSFSFIVIPFMKSLVLTDKIAEHIYTLRGCRVMLSPYLASLYGVAPKALIQAVKRNRYRFPADFMFQLDQTEFKNLKSQFVTSSWGGLRRAMPYAFTEQGVAMLSSIKPAVLRRQQVSSRQAQL